MLSFKNLGSGSTGNATLVQARGVRTLTLLVDCGLTQKELAARLAVAGLTNEDIDAVFVTHEHGDHMGCARQFSRRHGVPVWMSQGTYEGCGAPDFGELLRTARDGEVIDLGEMQIMPFTVPHDAREPLQLSCTDGARKLGILTDLGHATAHVLAHLANCHGLLLECNHDTDLLAQSSYPASLKRRVGGQYGHLSNASAAQIASAIKHPKLLHLVAAHLSVQNNRPELALQAMSDALDGSTEIAAADASTGSRWITL